ncbi:MAG: hypothetical protein P4M09_14610 [Devosia sp.]|nr:hypothetical protein [Devosia sp.]
MKKRLTANTVPAAAARRGDPSGRVDFAGAIFYKPRKPATPLVPHGQGGGDFLCAPAFRGTALGAV